MELSIDIIKKYEEIIDDLTSNSREVFQRKHYYTHKYRGDRLNDVCVYFERLSFNSTPYIVVFIRNKEKEHIKANLHLSVDRKEIRYIDIVNYKINQYE